MKESRDPSREGEALWLQPVDRPGQSKHRADMPGFGIKKRVGARVTAVAAGSENCRADMPGFGIKEWGKGDGRAAGRVRKLANWNRAMATRV